jgi:hypothetical protein
MSDSFAYQGKDKKRRKRRVVIWLMSFAMMLSTAGIAAWLVTSNNGLNSAKGNTGTLQAPTYQSVPDSQPAAGTLIAGGSNGSLTFRITNPNSVPLTITNIVDGVTPGADQVTARSAYNVNGGGAACNAADYTVNAGPYSTAVPTGQSYVTVPNSVSLAGNAHQDCQFDQYAFDNLDLTFST